MATKTETKDIIERFDDFFKEYRIEQLDHGRLRLVVGSTKAALFVDEKINEGLSAKDAVEWLLEFFIVKPNSSAIKIAEKSGLSMLIDVVEDIAPDSKQAAVQTKSTIISSDPEPVIIVDDLVGIDSEPKPPVSKKKVANKKRK